MSHPARLHQRGPTLLETPSWHRRFRALRQDSPILSQGFWQSRPAGPQMSRYQNRTTITEVLHLPAIAAGFGKFQLVISESPSASAASHGVQPPATATGGRDSPQRLQQQNSIYLCRRSTLSIIGALNHWSCVTGISQRSFVTSPFGYWALSLASGARIPALQNRTTSPKSSQPQRCHTTRHFFSIRSSF